MDEAPTGDGGGGGGGTSILTSPGAGGGPGAAKGGTSAGDGAAGANSAPPNAGASTASTNGGVKDWRMALPQDLQEDATIRKFADVPALAAAYINAQKLIGAEKIALPGKHASDEDWTNVYKKLGLPEDVKEYGINFKEGVTLDTDFVEAFKQTAHKAGILPKQAQVLADWFSDINTQAETKFLEDTKANQLKELEALKTEWGKAYDAKLARAQNVLKAVEDSEFIKHLDETGLGNDPKLIKFLAGIGDKFYKEDAIVQGGNGGFNILSPGEAKKKISEIQGNPTHPYHLGDHPGHKQAVKEMSDLFGLVYSE